MGSDKEDSEEGMKIEWGKLTSFCNWRISAAAREADWVSPSKFPTKLPSLNSINSGVTCNPMSSFLKYLLFKWILWVSYLRLIFSDISPQDKPLGGSSWTCLSSSTWLCAAFSVHWILWAVKRNDRLAHSYVTLENVCATRLRERAKIATNWYIKSVKTPYVHI